jgi:chromate transporter
MPVSWTKLVKVALIGGLLWLVPMGLLTASYGWQHTLTQMGWFFTKAALLTSAAPTPCCPMSTRARSGYGWLTPAR